MDVQDLQFIDSSGLGVILGRYRDVEEREAGFLYKPIPTSSGFCRCQAFKRSLNSPIPLPMC